MAHPHYPWVRPPSHNSLSLSSHAQPSPRKASSYTNFCIADGEVFTTESERRFAEAPLLTSCSAGEKFFRRILSDAGRHHIHCGYVRDYCGPLPDVVRFLIAERDQRYTDHPLDPAIKLLDRDTQRLIRQEAQDQWKEEFYDRATNCKRYWSLMRNLGSKRSLLRKKIHTISKAIAQAFNRQFTTCSLLKVVRREELQRL